MSCELRRNRVVLVGLGSTTLAALEGLVGDFDVVALIRNDVDATIERALEMGVAIHSDASPAGVRETIRASEPDAVVVSSYNRILDADLVEQCPFVNVHYAPLPRGRGRATVNWALINGDPETAISIHWLVPGLDAGGILFQAPVAISRTSTVTSLYDELNDLQRIHIGAAVKAAIAGEPGLEQDESQATYYCTRVPEDGQIDWSRSTVEIDRLIRASQHPFPLAFTWLGRSRFEVVSAEPVVDGSVFEGRIPGRVVRVDRDRGSVEVLTGDGILRLMRVRRDDGEGADAGSIVSSVRMTLGGARM